MTPVQITARAKVDLEDIWFAIAIERPRAAQRVLSEITSRFRTLSENPEIGRLRTELGRGIRCLNVGSYIVFYEVHDELVSVLRILHGARDIPSSFR